MPSPAVRLPFQAAGEAVQAGNPYRLILMDWRMPGMDGLAASRAILASVVPPPKIIMATAYAAEELAEDIQRTGIDGLLIKPVNAATLLDMTVQVMGHSVARPRVHATAEDPAKRHPRLRGARVLLAEDNEINQQIACELLEEVGMTVTVASDGGEALERMSTDFDIVLMDIQMPVMEGYAATKAILVDARFAGSPILAMTANAMGTDRDRALAAGMREHVSKPIDPVQLYDALDRWLPAGVGGGVAPERPVPKPTTDLVRLLGLLAADDTEKVELAERLADAIGHPGLAEVCRLAGDFDFAAALGRLEIVALENSL